MQSGFGRCGDARNWRWFQPEEMAGWRRRSVWEMRTDTEKQRGVSVPSFRCRVESRAQRKSDRVAQSIRATLAREFSTRADVGFGSQTRLSGRRAWLSLAFGFQDFGLSNNTVAPHVFCVGVLKCWSLLANQHRTFAASAGGTSSLRLSSPSMDRSGVRTRCFLSIAARRG